MNIPASKGGFLYFDFSCVFLYVLERKTSRKGLVMGRPKILVFASGSAEGGGSGFQNLVIQTATNVLDAHIVGVVSNHANGGVREKARILMVPFVHFPEPWNEERYWGIAESSGADFFAASGWLKLIVGLNPALTFNIHPGPLPRFGGEGMYGHHVHEAVIAAYRRGEISHSAVTMHFINKAKTGEKEKYDTGPVFFRFQVRIRPDDTAESLGKRINEAEHAWQPKITNMVVHREIHWDGVNPASLKTPKGYYIDHFENCP